MYRGMSGYLKGMGTGLAVGVIASIAGTVVYNNNKKTFKKTANRAVKAVGNLVDNVQYMMK